MNEQELKRILHDIAEYPFRISIHIERGSTNRPLNVLINVLNNIPKNHYEIILILDKNFLTNQNEIATLKDKGFCSVVKRSHSIPGIQIADIIAGTFRSFDEGDKQLLNIVLKRICEYSKNNLYAPSA